MYRFKKIPTDDWKEVCQEYWDFKKGGHRNHGKGKETAWKERNEYDPSTLLDSSSDEEDAEENKSSEAELEQVPRTRV